MNKYNIPIAKLGRKVLVAKESDLHKIGTDESLDVLVEQWDFKTGLLEGEYKLEILLKFNPWEDITNIIEVNQIRIELDKFRENRENPELKRVH